MKIYGIRNCDTMKKAIAWLDTHGIAYEFVDYKKPGVAVDRLPYWTRLAGAEALLNRRGLTWKKLDAEQRASVDSGQAVELMGRHPTLIRRPVLEDGATVLVGFDPDTYTQHFLT